MDIVLCLLAAIGLTNIMVNGVIMGPVRQWLKDHLPEKTLWFNPREAIDCHQCMGTWSGFVIGCLFLMKQPIFFTFLATYCNLLLACIIYGLFATISYVLLFGFAGSFLASFVYIFLGFIDSKTELPWSEQEDGTES